MMGTEQRRPQPAIHRCFEAAVLPHRPLLKRLALSLTRNNDDAEDLVQDTLVRAFSAFEATRISNSCEAWLIRILYNHFFNLYRQKKHRPITYSAPSLDDCTVFPAGWHMKERFSAASAEQVALKRAEYQALFESMASLPPHYRDILVLGGVGDIAYELIAHQKGLPVGTVRSRLHRSRQKIRKRLVPWSGSRTF
jgi:RNA polymerase sigma-70 factor, ECF subfamily